MKTKNKVLFARYDLYFRDIWKKPRNFHSLLETIEHRIGWRVDVIRVCDNWDEIVSADRKAFSDFCNPKIFRFPKKRCIPPEVFDPKCSMRNEYHIVKKKNNRYKIVRNKPQKTSVGRTLVVDTNRSYIREIGSKVWYRPDWMDFGCDTCVDSGTCRSGHYDKSFCAVATKYGIGHGNTWLEVREQHKGFIENMRTIKFKGKRLDDSEWVVGDLAHSLDGALNILGFDTKDSVTNFSGVYPIDPETVSQFTGFTDKNGREIYEGDILRSDKYPFSSIGEGIYERDNYYGIICWGEIEASFYIAVLKNPNSEVSGVSDGMCRPISQRNLRHFEVVGTVHSPEWQRKLDLKDE